MPVTGQESAHASARGEALSGPPLHRLRGSLVGTRFEFLKNAVFSAVLTVSLCMIAGGAGLLQPDNQFYADARAALRGFAGTAASSADSASGGIQVAAASAAQSVSGRVAGLIGAAHDNAAAQPPSSAAPAAANGAFRSATPAAPSEKPHPAKMKAGQRKSAAHHRQPAAQPAPPPAPAATPQQAAAWSFDRFTDELGDELAKAGDGIVNFFAGGVPAATTSARNGLNSAMGMMGVDAEPASFDPSRPETLFRAMTSTSNLIMIVGLGLFIIVVGVFVMSIKDSLRNASRRLRAKRSSGYA